VGKTHLAVGLGLRACALGYRTMFLTASSLVASLTRAHQENRLEEKLKLLVQPRLLIIDEIGYLPLERLGANLFFQLVSRRYERGSILITSNQSLAGWARSSATRSWPRRFWTGCCITRRSSTSRERATGSRRSAGRGC
jgi:DNA replication protein DnaC